MAVSLNANALITAAELETFLQITISDSDYKNTLINIASDFIEKYCANIFLPQATYTEEAYNGNGTMYVYLINTPVTAISAVKVWDTYNDVADQTLDEHDDYIIDLTFGRIYKRGGWTPGFKNYRITYTAGYTNSAAIPYDLKYACAKLCGLVNNEKNKGGIGSESMGKYSITYNKVSASILYGVAIPPDVMAMMYPYKRYHEL